MEAREQNKGKIKNHQIVSIRKRIFNMFFFRLGKSRRNVFVNLKSKPAIKVIVHFSALVSPEQ